jgi:hypothetical protein
VLIQKLSLKPQTASNADVEAQWLAKTPLKGRNLGRILERNQLLGVASPLLAMPGGDYKSTRIIRVQVGKIWDDGAAVRSLFVYPL